MQETEVKVLNINRDAIVAKLTELGATRVMDSTLVTEMAFKSRYHPARQDFLLRLRSIGNRNELTYKKDTSHGLNSYFKIEEEIETTVSDLEQTKTILEQIGYEVFRKRQKTREEFTCDNTKIEIDTYPGCTPYLEIEGAEADIEKMLGKLGFTLSDTSKETASQVLARLGKDPNNLLFDPPITS